MNKLSIFVAYCFIILSVPLFAQKADTVYFDSKWKPASKEANTYYRVMKKDGKVYQVSDYYNTGEIQMTGTFTSLSPEKRDGIFTWFYKNGNKSAQKIYSKNKYLSGEWWDEKGNPKKTDISELEKKPQFKGGMSEAYQYIKDHFVYPKGLNPRPVGKIYLSFVVDADGGISDVEVVESVHPFLDREAVRVVKSMPKWEPGILNGEPVRVKYRLPLSMK